MFKPYDCDFEKEMDRALHYTAKRLEESSHNTKPVLLHSFRVAMTLYQYEYSKDVVIGAILHDLIEDTDTKYEEIETHFSKKIADIVQAVSFDPKITDKKEQTRKLFANCIQYGKDALLVKCADLVDNIDYVSLTSKEQAQKLTKKYEYFLALTQPILKEEKIYLLLEKKYKNMK